MGYHFRNGFLLSCASLYKALYYIHEGMKTLCVLFAMLVPIPLAMIAVIASSSFHPLRTGRTRRIALPDIWRPDLDLQYAGMDILRSY